MVTAKKGKRISYGDVSDKGRVGVRADSVIFVGLVNLLRG
jgi:hypothetical protein